MVLPKINLQDAIKNRINTKELFILTILLILISFFFQPFYNKHSLAEETKATDHENESEQESSESDSNNEESADKKNTLDPNIVKQLLEKLNKLEEDENYSEIVESLDKLENKEDILFEVEEIKDLYITSLESLLSQNLESNKPNWQKIESYANKILEHINNHPLANYALGLSLANNPKPNYSKALKYLKIAKNSKNPPKNVSKVYWNIWFKKNLYYIIAALAIIIIVPIVAIYKSKKTKQESAIKELNLTLQELSKDAKLPANELSSSSISELQIDTENKLVKDLKNKEKNEANIISHKSETNTQLKEVTYNKSQNKSISADDGTNKQTSTTLEQPKSNQVDSNVKPSTKENDISNEQNRKLEIDKSNNDKDKQNIPKVDSSNLSQDEETTEGKNINYNDNKVEKEYSKPTKTEEKISSKQDETIDLDLQKALEVEKNSFKQEFTVLKDNNKNILHNFEQEVRFQVPNDSDLEKRWELLCKLASNSDIYEQLAVESIKIESSSGFLNDDNQELGDVSIDLSPEALQENLVEKLQMLAITDNELRALLQQRKIEHLPALCEYILTKPDPVRLAYIARELGYYHDPAVTDILIGLLNHEDPRVVIAAIQGLQINGLNQDIVHICPFIQSSIPAIFEAARTALTNFGPKRILEAFLDISSYADEKLRLAAVYLLARMKGSKVNDLLINLLNNDPSTEIRKQVILAMAFQKEPFFLPHLREYTRKTKSEEEKKLLRRAIVYLQNIESANRSSVVSVSQNKLSTEKTQQNNPTSGKKNSKVA